ncbi:MAG TPA: recombination protein RecR [Firmicutes bacterium]|nr:recombination protein RecR [Bacillota bacterium]HWR56266.1 recombination mediator RecR [Negativicutes bacterium]
MYFPQPLAKLIEQLRRLPGVGPKSAQRLAFHLLHLPPEEALKLADAIVEARSKLSYCANCFNLTENELCDYCASEYRDSSVICVVQEPRDIAAIEKTREFKGLYHVLQGALSPMEGIGPDQIRIQELLKRLAANEVTELILATSPNVEGEATAMYIARLVKPLGVKVTRIAHGMPVGGDLEYVDEVTLIKALENRREM